MLLDFDSFGWSEIWFRNTIEEEIVVKQYCNKRFQKYKDKWDSNGTLILFNYDNLWRGKIVNLSKVPKKI